MIYQGLKAQGYSVEVITADLHGKNDSADVKAIKPFDIRQLIGRKKIGSQRRQVSNSFLQKLMNSFPLNLLLGEGGIVYSTRVLSYLWKYRKQEVIIYSSYRPIVDHHVAYFFKLFNKKVYWIADYRDVLFDLDQLEVFLPNIQAWIYKKISRRASLVTTVSEGLLNYFEGYNSRLLTLRNAIEFGGWNTERSGDEQNSVFNIVYTGALYAGRRDPSILFEVLNGMIDKNPQLLTFVKLNYAGKESVVWDELIEAHGLGGINLNHGYVTREQSKRLQEQANINLLLTWSSPNNQGILTGKFYEYLKAGNPILTIISGSRDVEIDQLFSDYLLGEVVYKEGHHNLITFLQKEFDNWRNERASRPAISLETKKAFSWEENIKILVRELPKGV